MLKKTKEEAAEVLKRRIETEEDFVYCPAVRNSLKLLMKKHPEGLTNEKISKVLLIDEEEVEQLYNSALDKIRKAMTSGLN